MQGARGVALADIPLTPLDVSGPTVLAQLYQQLADARCSSRTQRSSRTRVLKSSPLLKSSPPSSRARRSAPAR